MNADDCDLVLEACLQALWELCPNRATESISARVAKLDRASRMSVLIPILGEAEPGYFWPIFVEWWPDFEFPHRWEDLADQLRQVHALVPAYKFLSLADRAFLDGLRGQVTVHRGAPRNFPAGISWTTDKATAEWFAHRFGETNAAVMNGMIFKRDIWAAFTGRGESGGLMRPTEGAITRVGLAAG